MTTTREPITTIDGTIVVRTEMTREHAARVIRALTDALVKDEPIAMEIRMDDRFHSFVTGERYGNVNISTTGGSLFGGDATVTDSYITFRDEN